MIAALFQRAFKEILIENKNLIIFRLRNNCDTYKEKWSQRVRTRVTSRV